MADYLEQNAQHWEPLYDTQHVESHVFRPFGRIIARELGLTGAGHERVLDFGCASGAVLAFYKSKGFTVFGVDISPANIEACQRRMPDCVDHFAVVDPMPQPDDVFFGGEFDLVLALDSLYYYTDQHLALRLQTLHRQLKPGGVIYATMIGSQSSAYADHSERVGNGLYRVNERVGGREHFINLTHSEEELARRFEMFQRRHIGFHAYQFREDEGSAFFYTYVGQKRR
jgi:SAM-dependent methyltransferase